MRSLAAAAIVYGTLCASPVWAATNWDLSTGFDYSAGRYGAATDTSVLSVPLSFRAQMDQFRLELSLPYLSVKGPGTYTGGGVVGTGPVTTNSGLGDLTIGGAWLLHADQPGGLPSFELAGSIKAPTASGTLGTGEFDYSLQANVAHSISPNVMLFGSLGYQWLSDFSTFDLQSGLTAQAGVNFKASDAVNFGLSGGFREPYAPGVGNQYSLTPYALWNFASNWKVSTYALMGFSRASPRIGGGMRLIYYR